MKTTKINKGIIELIDNYKYFRCLECSDRYFMKFYRAKMKEAEEELIIEEVDLDNK